MNKNALPTTLLEAIRYFADPETCVDFVASLRWPDGPVCPSCEGKEHSFLSSRLIWKCKGCKKQFSVKKGTIFEESGLPLDKWLASIWLIANSKNGVSSHELARSVGMTQKSAWFVLHRIRLAMQTGTFEKLCCEVEADETFVGGKARNMHAHVRKQKITGSGPKDKIVVFGVKSRTTGTVRAEVIPDRSRASLHARVRSHVEPGAALYTDSLSAYQGMREYEHAMVDHAEKYVDGKVHTNGIENFWSLLKRGLHGTYVSVAPCHLSRYLDERVFTFNEREQDDYGRFSTVLSRISGRRLTYSSLTGKA